MANGSIPSYLTSATPNPLANRAPWFKNTAQSYAGIFLWIAFFEKLGGTTQGPAALSMANLGVCLAALVCAGALSVVLFYLVPGLLGMQTGLPLYIVGSSTFGTKGGYFLPGIFMGLLQIGWYSVATYYAARLVLQGFGRGDLATTPYGEGGEFSIVFVITAVVWGYVFAFLGAKGIDYVARVATFLPLLIIAMLVIGAIIAAGSLGSYDRADSSKAAFVAANVLDAAEKAADEAAQKAGKTPTEAAAVAADARAELAEKPADAEQIKAATASLSNDQPAGDLIENRVPARIPQYAGFLLIIQMVIGFFATAGAVGADFCSNNRNTKDVWMGGIVGIGLAILVAGGLALITVAGAHGQMLTQLADGTAKWGHLANYTYSGTLPLASPGLGKIMLLLFAIGSMAPACFCSFIIGNSLSTMLGSAKTRVPLTMGGATIGIALAALGVASNLEIFFGLIGAAFGPVIGAMIADYLLSGRRWAGPREGISIPGYAAWVCGFAVGVLNHPWVGVLPGWQITSVYSLIVGLVVYWILAKAGLEGKVVELPNLKTPEATAA